MKMFKTLILASAIAVVGTVAFSANTITTFVAPLLMTLGGSGAALTPSNGGVVYTNGSNMQVLNGTSVVGRPLVSNPNAAPTWGTDPAPSIISACGGSITVDGTSTHSWVCTLTSNLTLANPSQVTPGYDFQFKFVQPDTGGPFTITFGTNWQFPAGAAPALSTIAGATDILNCKAYTSTQIVCNPLQANLQTSVAPFLAMTPPAGYTRANLYFEDNFSEPTLDSTWNVMGEDRFIYSDQGRLPYPYTGANCDSNNVCGNNFSGGLFSLAYYDQYPYGYGTSTTGVQHMKGGNGVLQMIATPDTKFASLGYSWATSAMATWSDPAHARGGVYMPSTGGYLQWSAKMPDSRFGAWANLWLLPADGNAAQNGLLCGANAPNEQHTCEIDLQESGTVIGGNANASIANRMLAVNWHAGPNAQKVIDTGQDLTAAYHVYGMEFRPGVSIKFYFDGALVQTYTNNIPRSGGSVFELIVDFEIASSVAACCHTIEDRVNHPGPFTYSMNGMQLYNLP